MSEATTDDRIQTDDGRDSADAATDATDPRVARTRQAVLEAGRPEPR